jgi:prepilin-type N-terminal cleavage/methylation domain-containing protein
MMPRMIRKQQGFSLIETLISLGILSVVGAGVLTKVKTIKHSLQETSRVMSMDALEAGLGNYMRSRSIIYYSANKSTNGQLKNCFNQGLCSNGQGFEVPLYIEGVKDSLTGPDVTYDESGTVCEKACKGFQIITTLRPSCSKANTCNGPDFVSVEAEVRSSVDRKTIRRFAYDMQKYTGSTFPGLSLSCKDSNSVLRGIGLQGEPLCTPKSGIVLMNSENKPVSTNLTITPQDCSLADKKAEDQTHVAGYQKDGKIICAPRFW